MFAFLVILSLGLDIEHAYWKWTKFCITLEWTMSKMLLQNIFFGSCWILKIVRFQQESAKKQVWLIKRQFFQAFLTWFTLKLCITKFISNRHVQYQVLKIKWLKMQTKQIFKNNILNDFVCIFSILIAMWPIFFL